MMTTRTWSLCSDLDGVGTAMITSRVMSVPSSAHPRRVANSSRSPRQADFADPLGGTRTPVAADPGRHDAIRNPDLVEGRRTTDGRARHRERHTGRPQVVTAGTVAVATTPDADVRDRSLAERLPHWNPPGPRPKAGT